MNLCYESEAITSILKALFTVHHHCGLCFLEVSLVFGEIKWHFQLPKASCTCDFTVMLIWHEPSSVIESLGLLAPQYVMSFMYIHQAQLTKQ